MKRANLLAGLLMVVCSGAVHAQDALMKGTRKANVSKSRYVPGAVPKDEVLRIELLGDGFKVSLDGVNQQGPYHSEATGRFDGVDVPVFATPPQRPFPTLVLTSAPPHPAHTYGRPSKMTPCLIPGSPDAHSAQ